MGSSQPKWRVPRSVARSPEHWTEHLTLGGNMAPRPADPVTPAPGTPASVTITTSAPAPVTDPTLGIPVPLPAAPAPLKHRLVSLGDSLTHGFQSGAIFNTSISYPRLIAMEMGWADNFSFPRYGGPGGLPLNLEYLVRTLEQKFGDRIRWWDFIPALFDARRFMDQVEDYWERGVGATVPPVDGILHNLAIYGWDLRD